VAQRRHRSDRRHDPSIEELVAKHLNSLRYQETRTLTHSGSLKVSTITAEQAGRRIDDLDTAIG